MNEPAEDLKHKDISDKILHAFFKVVYPQLGYGFLEKVYENAFVIALCELGLKVKPQAMIEESSAPICVDGPRLDHYRNLPPG